MMQCECISISAAAWVLLYNSVCEWMLQRKCSSETWGKCYDICYVNFAVQICWYKQMWQMWQNEWGSVAGGRRAHLMSCKNHCPSQSTKPLALSVMRLLFMLLCTQFLLFAKHWSELFKLQTTLTEFTLHNKRLRLEFITFCTTIVLRQCAPKTYESFRVAPRGRGQAISQHDDLRFNR